MYKTCLSEIFTNKLSLANAGLPQGRENSGKTKKKDKSQEKSGKNGGFEKKSGNLTKL